MPCADTPATSTRAAVQPSMQQLADARQRRTRIVVRLAHAQNGNEIVEHGGLLHVRGRRPGRHHGLPGDERTSVGATRDARHLVCNLQPIDLAR